METIGRENRFRAIGSIGLVATGFGIQGMWCAVETSRAYVSGL